MMASGVISTMSCGGTYALTASATCGDTTYQAVLEQFSNNLQWNAGSDILSPTLTDAPGSTFAPMANGTESTSLTTWDAVSLPISVTGSSLELADNYVNVARGATHWSPAGTTNPQTAPYNFNSQQATNTSGFAPGTVGASGTPGDYLLGSGVNLAAPLNTTSSTPADAITLASTAPLSSFGFRVESATYTSFDVVIQLYGSGGLSDPLGTETFTNLSGGGTCATLGTTVPGPTACNTAPFVMVTSPTGVYSFTVYTTQANGSADNGGFFLDSFSFNEEPTDVPEPASLLLAGAGLMSMVAFARRRNRRQALGYIGAKSIDKA